MVANCANVKSPFSASKATFALESAPYLFLLFISGLTLHQVDTSLTHCPKSGDHLSLAQLMLGTARELGVSNAFDTEQNLRAVARYLVVQIGRFSDIRLALAAYNSGPNRVARLGRVPDFQET